VSKSNKIEEETTQKGPTERVLQSTDRVEGSVVPFPENHGG